jgi:hypothetical protein
VNKLLLGLATYIMQKTVNGCFTEKTRRMPLRLEKVLGPIPNLWESSFREQAPAQDDLERFEQKRVELEKKLLARSGMTA